MKRLLPLLLVLLLAAPAQAIIGNTFIYAKTVIKIVPKAEAPQPEPATPSESDKKNAASPLLDAGSMMPTLRRAPKEFTVEVRTEQFLHQRDFIMHQPFSDREGILILIDPPAMASLTATRMITSADVLFVDADGNIVKIAPDLQLSTLSETIESGRPIHAFIYLKAGTAVASDIRIGDKVENANFKTHPVIIE